jgi:pimeloyl-ACP methyl ester carboxylesterase
VGVNNPRKYGKRPFGLAVVHGGPGAAGEMAVVARVLSSHWGVMEPLQTEKTVGSQVEELREILEKNGKLPVVLIGFSWGAWLGFIATALHPGMIKKLILVGCGPFYEKDAKNLLDTRLNRLSPEQREEAETVMESLANPLSTGKDRLLSRLGHLISIADAYDPFDYNTEGLMVSFDIYQSVWPEANQMRRKGELLDLGARIQCPVVAIHGDYDPHPARGVEIPLSDRVADFRFLLINKCGHRPWIERQARDIFFKALKEEIQEVTGTV